MTLLRSKIVALFEILTILLIFLLPLKFSSIAAVPEVPYIFFDNIAFWFFAPWPISLFSILVGVHLMFSVSFILPHIILTKTRLFYFVLIGILLAFISLLGFINASVSDYPIHQVTHIFSVIGLMVSIFILLESNPKLCKSFISAIIAGISIAALHGLYQYFYGFEETQKFALEREHLSGISFIKGNFKSRLMESRVFAYFAIANSFAAHLILVIPITSTALFHYGQKLPAMKRYIYTVVLSCLLLIVLYLTGSRAAILSLFLSVLLIFIALKFNKKVIYTLIFLAFPLIAFIIYNYDRGVIPGIAVRVDYWIVATKVFFSHFFIGTGWGDFFHEYTILKMIKGAEAPHTPHNLILSFASQVGVLGLLLSTLLLFYPVYYGIKFLRDREPNYFNISILIGWLAWSLHSLTDFNLQTPATFATALILVIIFFKINQNDDKETSRIKILFPKYLITTTIILIVLFGGRLLLIGEIAFANMKYYCDPRFATKETFASRSVQGLQEYLEQCKNIIPYSPFPYAEAAAFSVWKNDLTVTELYLKETIKRSPERAVFYYKLYQVQLKLGNQKDAMNNLKIAQKLFPNKYAFMLQPPEN